MMQQPIESTPDPNTTPPREPPPTLEEAAALLTDPRVLVELAYHGRDCRTRDELAARLVFESVRALRCAEGLEACRDYRAATIEQERSVELRLWAEALRVVESCG